MKSNFRYVLIAVMVLIEQGIKLVIRNYQGGEVNLIGNFVYFRPTHNTYYSWFNSMLGFENTRMFHIILTLALLVLAILVFRYVYKRKGNQIEANLLEIFLISGIICSLLDRVFWGGSLDYIGLRGLFVFDLKDVYLSTFQVLGLFLAIKYWKAIDNISEKKLALDFWQFLKGN